MTGKETGVWVKRVSVYPARCMHHPTEMAPLAAVLAEIILHRIISVVCISIHPILW